MKIAALLTCHNRSAKTERCLASLKIAINEYNLKADDSIQLEVFLTDDGCTDNTVEVARQIFSNDGILHIIEGNGSLYWAGGMRFCWKEAMKRHEEWDYYLLLNDDIELMQNVFAELFMGEQYAVNSFGKKGIVSGITCSKENRNLVTYGGDVWKNKFLATRRRLVCNGTPQLCDVTNANILLVPQLIVDTVGIFYEGFTHGAADFDYSVMVRKAGYPVVLTANACGYCEMDHLVNEALAKRIIGMSLKERKDFFTNPVHSNRDYLRFIRRISPIRLPMVWFGRILNLYFPRLYYHFSGARSKLSK